MSSIDLAQLRGWIGIRKEDRDVLGVRHARLMAATLGLGQEALIEGSRLPPLWHWLYFLEGLPPGELGRDGHPARGGFLPRSRSPTACGPGAGFPFSPRCL